MTNSAFVILASLFLASLYAASPAVLAQDVPADDSATQAHTYCVKSGYLYSTSPSVNSGQGICMFPDKSWCDAQAFLRGECSQGLSPNILPFYATMEDDDWSQPAERMCSNSGGTVSSVHTPYGDIAMCVFPDGVTCDLKSITEGRCGEDAWTRYARSWLNAP